MGWINVVYYVEIIELLFNRLVVFLCDDVYFIWLMYEFLYGRCVKYFLYDSNWLKKLCNFFIYMFNKYGISIYIYNFN